MNKYRKIVITVLSGIILTCAIIVAGLIITIIAQIKNNDLCDHYKEKCPINRQINP